MFFVIISDEYFVKKITGTMWQTIDEVSLVSSLRTKNPILTGQILNSALFIGSNDKQKARLELSVYESMNIYRIK
jgi:hypothetical protein